MTGIVNKEKDWKIQREAERESEYANLLLSEDQSRNLPWSVSQVISLVFGDVSLIIAAAEVLR